MTKTKTERTAILSLRKITTFVEALFGKDKLEALPDGNARVRMTGRTWGEVVTNLTDVALSNGLDLAAPDGPIPACWALLDWKKNEANDEASYFLSVVLDVLEQDFEHMKDEPAKLEDLLRFLRAIDDGHGFAKIYVSYEEGEIDALANDLGRHLVIVLRALKNQDDVAEKMLRRAVMLAKATQREGNVEAAASRRLVLLLNALKNHFMAEKMIRRSAALAKSANRKE